MVIVDPDFLRPLALKGMFAIFATPRPRVGCALCEETWYRRVCGLAVWPKQCRFIPWSKRKASMKKLARILSLIFVFALSAQSGIAFAADPVIAEGAAITAAQFDAVKAVQKKYEASLLQTAASSAWVLGWPGEAATSRCMSFLTPRLLALLLRRLSASADGIPVEIIESDEIKAFAGEANRLQYNLPVPMGASTSNSNGCYAGILGVRVYRAGQTSKVGYITNTHVASPGGANLCPGQAAFGVDEFQRASLDTSPQCSRTGWKKMAI